MSKGPKTELERTCTRCGAVRYVSRDAIKHAKGAGWATPLVGRKRQEIRANRAIIEQNQQAAETCPQCGSSAYDEREVPIPG